MFVIGNRYNIGSVKAVRMSVELFVAMNIYPRSTHPNLKLSLFTWQFFKLIVDFSWGCLTPHRSHNTALVTKLFRVNHLSWLKTSLSPSMRQCGNMTTVRGRTITSTTWQTLHTPLMQLLITELVITHQKVNGSLDLQRSKWGVKRSHQRSSTTSWLERRESGRNTECHISLFCQKLLKFKNDQSLFKERPFKLLKTLISSLFSVISSLAPASHISPSLSLYLISLRDGETIRFSTRR